MAEKTTAVATDRVAVVECEPLFTRSDQVVESEKAIKLESETAGSVLTESLGSADTKSGSLLEGTIESGTNVFDVVKSGSGAVDRPAEIVTVANETNHCFERDH